MFCCGDKADSMMKDMFEMTKKIEKLTEIIEKQQIHLHKDVEEIKKLEENKKKEAIKGFFFLFFRFVI
jgi:Na+/phosphate symporter